MVAVADYMTVAEAARALGVSERAIHKRIAGGLMRAERFGAHVWQIPVEEVERWRSIGRLKPGPKPSKSPEDE
jgi:excisionase family DNA binding protein